MEKKEGCKRRLNYHDRVGYPCKEFNILQTDLILIIKIVFFSPFLTNDITYVFYPVLFVSSYFPFSFILSNPTSVSIATFDSCDEQLTL